jgi:hypothetical protein
MPAENLFAGHQGLFAGTELEKGPIPILDQLVGDVGVRAVSGDAHFGPHAIGVDGASGAVTSSTGSSTKKRRPSGMAATSPEKRKSLR